MTDERDSDAMLTNLLRVAEDIVEIVSSERAKRRRNEYFHRMRNTASYHSNNGNERNRRNRRRRRSRSQGMHNSNNERVLHLNTTRAVSDAIRRPQSVIIRSGRSENSPRPLILSRNNATATWSINNRSMIVHSAITTSTSTISTTTATATSTTTSATATTSSDQYKCALCLNNFMEREPMTTACGHIFCKLCILELKRRKGTSCPICKSCINYNRVHRVFL